MRQEKVRHLRIHAGILRYETWGKPLTSTFQPASQPPFALLFARARSSRRYCTLHPQQPSELNPPFGKSGSCTASADAGVDDWARALLAGSMKMGLTANGISSQRVRAQRRGEHIVMQVRAGPRKMEFMRWHTKNYNETMSDAVSQGIHSAVVTTARRER